MSRGLLVGLVALVASANAFVVPGTTIVRPAQSAGCVKMVTSPGVGVSKPASTGKLSSLEPVYTAALEKMEAEAWKDIEQAFEETAIKAQKESDAIWAKIDEEFPEEPESS